MAEETTKKRPRLELDNGGSRERKRGKSVFGLVVGTLNRAKIEDKERSASEAAKKRQLLEQRLQTKLRRETDSVRRAEEAKKDKIAATRKEEELQLQDSLHKFRRTRLPLYANFLLTSDLIPDDADADTNDDTPPNPAVLAHPPRTHPPPLYYLPAVLLPAQQSFLARRKRDTLSASAHEYTLFRQDRARAIEAVNALRQRVADEEARGRTDPPDAEMHVVPQSQPAPEHEPEAQLPSPMDVDADSKDDHDLKAPAVDEKKDDHVVLGADEDDAVEY